MNAQPGLADTNDFGTLGWWMTILVVYAAFHFGENFDFFYAVGAGLQDERQAAAQIAAAAAGAGSALRPVAFLTLGMFGVLAWIARPGRGGLGAHGYLPALLILFLAYACLSITWAEDQDIVLRRVIILVLLCAAALGLASRFSAQSSVAFALVISGVVCALGIAAELALGTFRPWVPDYRFHGLQHPNTTGGVAATAALAAITLAKLNPRYRRLLLIVAAIGFVVVVLTKSRAAMAGLVVGLWAWWFLGSANRKAVAAKSVLAAALLVPVMIFVLGDGLGSMAQKTVLMGREDQSPQTLTGRVPLWTMLLDRYVEERPIFGYGFDGFWTPRHVVTVATEHGWTIGHAHSGYVNVLLDLGFIGLGLFVLILVAAVTRSYRFYALTQDRAWLFMTALLLSAVVQSTLDVVLLVPGLRNFILMVVLAKLALSAPDVAPARQPAFV